MSSLAFRNLLEAGDVDGVMSAWRELFPNMPAPQTREDAKFALHYARTAAESVSFKARAYSHRWLTERARPSGLPDALKPKAERLYPSLVEAVGFSQNFRADWMKPAKPLIERAVSDAIEDAYAEGRTDPAFVSSRMKEAKEREQRKLFGNFNLATKG